MKPKPFHIATGSKQSVEVRLFAGLRRRPQTGCWEWTRCRFKTTGYGQLKIGDRNVATHRVAWQVYFGPAADGMRVLHTCDNRLCCNPDHLFLGSQADNVADMMRKGRHGTAMPDETARAILRLKGRLSQRSIAAMFGLTQPDVSRIHRGDRFKRLAAEGCL